METIKLSEKGFNKLVEILDNPPPPTEALVALMSETKKETEALLQLLAAAELDAKEGRVYTHSEMMSRIRERRSI